jgi:hypothetical protein
VHLSAEQQHRWCVPPTVDKKSAHLIKLRICTTIQHWLERYAIELCISCICIYIFFFSCVFLCMCACALLVRVLLYVYLYLLVLELWHVDVIMVVWCVNDT